MNRERFIRVPKDKKAMEDYDYGIQSQSQMEELILSEEEYQSLNNTKIFDIINERCNVLIDDYEEEILKLPQLPIALEIVDSLISNSENKNLINLKRMFELATNYKTIVGFDF